MTSTEILRNKVKLYVDNADEESLRKVETILEEKGEQDWWDELPESMQRLIESAIKEGNAGKGIPHEQIIAKYSKWFKK